MNQGHWNRALVIKWSRTRWKHEGTKANRFQAERTPKQRCDGIEIGEVVREWIVSHVPGHQVCRSGRK